MKRLNLTEIINDPEVDALLDPYAFEKYCGSCIWFDTEKCPHYGKVLPETLWELKNCNNFWD